LYGTSLGKGDVRLVLFPVQKIKVCGNTLGSYWGANASKLLIAVIRKKDGNQWLAELEFFFSFGMGDSCVE